MFRKMQIKLTIYYSLIVAVVLILSNLSVYFLLLSYNESQLENETDRMLSSINSSEWTKKIDSDDYYNITDTIEKDESDNDDLEKDDSDMDNSKGERFQGSIISSENIKVANNLKSNDSSKVEFSPTSELVIPNIFEDFTFYYIFSLDNQLLKNKTDFEDLNTIILDEITDLKIGERPKVLILEKPIEKRFLAQKMNIIIDNKAVGYYVVGRDVSLAYETIDNLLRIIIIGLAIGMIVSVILGYIIAGKVMKPIKKNYYARQIFLADVSHELRTPISVMLLSCDALDINASDDIENKNLLVSNIRDEAKQMKSLVDSLLQLARYDNKNAVNIEDKVNISILLQSINKQLLPLSKDKNLEIRISVEEKLFLIGDKKLLSSLFSIVIENAIKYTPNHGIVMISARKNLLNKQEVIHVEIKDTGIGIAKNELNQIFNRYYRVEDSQNNAGGYGLGLAIAKETVEIHSGQIHIESDKELGTTVIIDLPINRIK